MSLQDQQHRVLQLVEHHQGCTSSQIAWLFVGGVVRDDQMVGSVTLQPNGLVLSKNVSARLTDLIKAGKVKRSESRYYTTYPVRPQSVRSGHVEDTYDYAGSASRHIGEINQLLD